MAQMHVVFLQGMPSPFFSRIARKLTELGCKTTGINLCAGDWIFWKGSNTLHFRGTLAEWPVFIADFFDAHQVTDLVLLGEQRCYHKQAVEIAKQCGIRVTVTDFGYLRPDWITLERDGMSSNSRFPRNMDEISKLAAILPKADLNLKYDSSVFNMAIGDLLYSFSNVLLWFLYPHYQRSDRRPHPIIYFPAVGLRLLLAKSRHKKSCAGMQVLLEAKTRYFFFPLQLEHDFQIVAYSPFGNMQEPIELIIKSFARNADKDTHLVIKLHPWDPGLKNWETRIFRVAKECGVSERVHYFDGGYLGEMIQNSLGMITVNSTSGVQALQQGSPVVTLGEAIYNIPGLTYQDGLDRFWTDAQKPDAELVNDFFNAMAGTIQVRGVFFKEPGLSNAVIEAAERIYNGTVGIPQTI